MTPKEKRTLVSLLVGYGLTLAAASGFGYYAYGEYKDARDQEAAIQKQVQLANIKIGRIDDLEVDVICLRENLSEAAKILPDDTEVNEFVNKLNDFADESGILVRELTDQKDRSRTKDSFDKVIYKVSMLANVEQFLSFLALAEGWERFVKVTSIEVKGGSWDEDSLREDVRHEIAVSLQTYAYRGPDESKTVPILNYEARRDALREEILARRAEIQVERYNFLPNPLRRDMFIDPRVRVSDQGEGGLPLIEQRALVDEMIAQARELEGLVEQVAGGELNFIRRLEVETEIDRRLAKLDDQLESVIRERSITDTTLRRRIDRDVRPIVQALLDRDSSIVNAANTEDLRRFHTEMAVLLDEGDYEGVLARYETIRGRLDEDDLDYAGVALLHQIEKAARQAEVALEFSSLELDIRGAIVSSGGRSVATINGRVLEEGEALEDDLVVHRITEERIEFRYRGVILGRAR